MEQPGPRSQYTAAALSHAPISCFWVIDNLLSPQGIHQRIDIVSSVLENLHATYQCCIIALQSQKVT
ncbi:hypothetical protein I312_104614 [Cryptococcus bacillisporus CA1280]|uniref:uncharacterized protein n=1 Tax=Cryptococcus bacillisporus CA1280 TaxID=1296109 RepID=UPI00336951FD